MILIKGTERFIHIQRMYYYYFVFTLHTLNVCEKNIIMIKSNSPLFQ